jgi:MATE family multidrug resistance protein
MLAGVWAKYILLGLWPSLVFQVLKKYLQGCNVVWPVIVSNFVSTIVNIVVNYILIDIYGWGFTGAALTVGIAQWAGLICLVIIISLQITYIR